MNSNVRACLFAAIDRKNANTLLALDQMGVRWVDIELTLHSALLDSVNQNVLHFTSQDIANRLLALDQMGLRWVDLDRRLQSALLNSVKHTILHFNSQDIANTLLALAEMDLEIVGLNDRGKFLLDAVSRLCLIFDSGDIITCVEALDHIVFFWKDFPDRLQTELFNTIKQNYSRLKKDERGRLMLRLSRLSMLRKDMDSLASTK